MSRNLSHVLLASPPSWNTVSQHPTVVTYCTVLYGTGVQRVHVQVSTYIYIYIQNRRGLQGNPIQIPLVMDTAA